VPVLDRVERGLVRLAERGERFFGRFRNPLRTENYFGYRPVEVRNDPQDVHKHTVVYVLPAFEVGIAAFVLVFFLAQGPSDALGVVVLLCFALAGHGAYVWLRESRDVFVLTVERVFRVSGVFAQQKATAPVARLLDITVDKPFMGRLLGYGHLILETAAQEQGLRELRYVPDPDEVNGWIDNVRAGLTPLGNQRRP
jgi:hypothetical protein